MPRAAVKLAKLVRLVTGDASDAELVERYLQGQSAALEMIVRRHGPTVLGVCRRILGANADAEDAFQATFLTLSLRARTIRKPEALNAWLHGVALRCYRKAIGRRAPSIVGNIASRSDPFAEVSWREERGLLDEELHRLPTKLQSPLILCHPEGRTRDEAAKLLRWSLRTFDRRLARGRELLKARLVRRGVATLGLGVSVLSGSRQPGSRLGTRHSSGGLVPHRPPVILISRQIRFGQSKRHVGPAARSDPLVRSP